MTVSSRADGKELPEDLRQKTDPQLGVLTVLSVQKGVDSGAYSCVASNKHGHSAKRTTTVDVIGKANSGIVSAVQWRPSGVRFFFPPGVAKHFLPNPLKSLPLSSERSTERRATTKQSTAFPLNSIDSGDFLVFIALKFIKCFDFERSCIDGRTLFIL